MSGDLHALAYGRIRKSGALDFSRRPVHAFCVGPLGSAGPGFPSRFRGVGASPPSDLAVDEELKPLENNGFSIVDVTPESVGVRLFGWLPSRPEEDIDALEPLSEIRIAR